MKQGERVQVVGGEWNGRLGVIVKRCTPTFAAYVRVRFDLRPRERVQKTQMIHTKDLMVLREEPRP